MKGAGQDHVKVKFRSEIMTFYFNPDDTYLSFKTKVATKIQRSRFVLRFKGTDEILVDIQRPDCNNWTLRHYFGHTDIQNGELLDVIVDVPDTY